jgi:hypothetical protein
MDPRASSWLCLKHVSCGKPVCSFDQERYRLRLSPYRVKAVPLFIVLVKEGLCRLHEWVANLGVVSHVPPELIRI